MNEAVLLLYLLNFIFVGLLPKIFFKKDGRFNLMWWLTAAPFLICTLSLIASYAGYISPVIPPTWIRWLEVASVPVSAASIGLLFFTLGTHRIPIALWHQNNDAPKSIVTYGAYKRIRHPFYASFLLVFVGAFIFCPHWITFLTLVYGFLILSFTAAREERRLSASEFGAEYQDYMRRTGRFLPKLNLTATAEHITES